MLNAATFQAWLCGEFDTMSVSSGSRGCPGLKTICAFAYEPPAVGTGRQGLQYLGFYTMPLGSGVCKTDLWKKYF
jgi:hypothetical protein